MPRSGIPALRRSWVAFRGSGFWLRVVLAERRRVAFVVGSGTRRERVAARIFQWCRRRCPVRWKEAVMKQFRQFRRRRLFWKRGVGSDWSGL